MITLENYTTLFKFRADTYAEQQEDGSYKRIFRRLTTEDLKAHIIDHTKVLALYPSVGGKCFIGAIDLDIPHKEVDKEEGWRLLERQIKSIVEQLYSLGISKPVLVEKTGGRGYHIWIFSEELQASQMYDFLKQIIDSLGIEAEIFPIDTIERGIGRGIRPPLGTHLLYKSRSFFVDSNFKEIELTHQMIMDIDNHKITIEDMNRLGILSNDSIKDYHGYQIDYKNVPKVSSFEEVYDEIRPCFQGIYDDKMETKGGEGWNFMTAAAAEILANGGRDADVHTYFSVQEQYKKRITNKHLRPIKQKNLMPFTCDKLIERCSKYVGIYCGDCRINKQRKIYEKLEEAVDQTQGKEERTLGGIRQTIEQFQYVAEDIQDILTHQKYTIVLNGFNKGKTWSAVAMMKNIIGEGGRVNFVAHTKKVKEIISQRLKKARVGFLDNPNNLELCLRAEEFTKLGYVPSAICRGCPYKSSINKLIKPLMDDYIEGANKPFFGTLSRYKEIAQEYDTCAKWVYLSLLTATIDENLVILLTDSKVKHHLFIPNSTLLPILKSGTLFCTVIDQIDFINRKIPKIIISDHRMEQNLKKLGLMHIGELGTRYKEIGLALEEEITPEGLDELEAAEELKRWVYLNEEYQEGRMRRLYNIEHPEVKIYDIMGPEPMQIIMNDIFAKKINPRLYDKTIEYIRNLRVECITEDGKNRAPLSFREIIESYTDNSAVLGITSTPTDIEIASSQWWASDRDSKKGILNNLYEIPKGTDIFEDAEIDRRTIIYSRKNEQDYINDGEVRGNTSLGGNRDDVIIESLQYPRNSEAVITDLIQLCGGNIGKGTKIFYQGIIADAVTQAAKYNSDKIYVPNTDIFTALGFNVSNDNSFGIKIWEDRVMKKLFEKKGVYRHQIKSIPDGILENMIESGFLKMKGKKYFMGTT